MYVVSGQADDFADRIQLAEPLREAGFTVATDYSTRPLDRQLEGAVKHGAKVAVIRGTEEARGWPRHRPRPSQEGAARHPARRGRPEVGRHVPRRPRPSLAPPATTEPAGEA